MNFLRLISAVAAAGAVTLSAADLTKITEAKRWSPSECTVTQAEKGMTVNMPIDHKKGQYPKYLIGWPRLYLYKINAAEKDWSKAKSVSFKIKMEFTGTTQKQELTFRLYTQGPNDKKALTYTFPVPGLVNNKEVVASFPLDKVKSTENVVMLGFSISESRYKHGENLKFTVSDFTLTDK